MKVFSYLRNNSTWQDGFFANRASDYLRRPRIVCRALARQLRSDVNFLLTSADMHMQMHVCERSVFQPHKQHEVPSYGIGNACAIPYPLPWSQHPLTAPSLGVLNT